MLKGLASKEFEDWKAKKLEIENLTDKEDNRDIFLINELAKNAVEYLKERYEEIVDISCQKNVLDYSKEISNKCNQTSIKYDKSLIENYKKYYGIEKSITKIIEILSKYKDLIFSQQFKFPTETYFSVIALHSLNHILNCNKIIKRNSQKLSKDSSLCFKDQGFTKPRVLILLPFKWMAKKFVKSLTCIHGSKQIMNKSRFFDDYNPNENHISLSQKRKRFPNDYQKIFQGNIDDHFRIGISVEKDIIKLFQDFYKSDIIIASPLGLKTMIGTDSENSINFDFLSSIQITILFYTNIFMMQNLEHVYDIFTYLNNYPSDTSHTDFSRIYEHSKDKLAKFYRQNIIFSEFMFPEINCIIRQFTFNFSGIKFFKTYIDALKTNKIVLNRFFCDSIDKAHIYRFESFIEVIKCIKCKDHSHILVFVSSYVDFLKIFNRFKDDDFLFISEYTSESKASKIRKSFSVGKKSILVITERFYFYNRPKFKEIRYIIFYEIPFNPQYIKYLSSHINESTSDSGCMAIFSNYDYIRLSNAFGKNKAKKIIERKFKTRFIINPVS